MALNSSHRLVIDQRRAQVSHLRLRGFTQRQIAAELERRGVVNAEGEAWSLGTVNGDVKALEREWRRQAAADIETAKGQQREEIRSAKQAAWANEDINQVRLLIKLEMELLGTEAPKQTRVTGPDGGPVQHEHRGQVHGSVEHLAAVLAALAGAGALQLPGAGDGAAAEDDGLHPA